MCVNSMGKYSSFIVTYQVAVIFKSLVNACKIHYNKITGRSGVHYNTHARLTQTSIYKGLNVHLHKFRNVLT